ncbi:hypothetical protein NU219Hw_g7703t1 [Hortaea werneckii]
MGNNIRQPRQLLRPTGQRACRDSNELLEFAILRRPNRLKSGLFGYLSSDIEPGLLAPKHVSRAHSEVGSGGQPQTTCATETTSSKVTEYPCVRCWKTFKKYPDMVRHFEELHAISKKYHCPECHQSHKRKEHVKNHYATRHSSSREMACIPVEVITAMDLAVFGCGFCEGSLRYGPTLSCWEDILQALSHVKEHILEGKAFTEWNVTHQIEGLLLHVLLEWYEVCRQAFDCPFENWPRPRWTPEVAKTFVPKLEQPIARTRLRPLLQELLLAGLGPTSSSSNGGRIVSNYSQAELDFSSYGSEPIQEPLSPLLYSSSARNDLARTATSDFNNLFSPVEASDSSLPQLHNPEEQELLLQATGSQFPQSIIGYGTYYANTDVLPSEASQDTIGNIDFRNDALFPDALTTSNWISDQQSMCRPGNELLQSLSWDPQQDFFPMPD